MYPTHLSTTLRQSGFFAPWRDRPTLTSRRPTPSYATKERVIAQTLIDAQRILADVGADADQDVQRGLRLIHRRLFDTSLNADAVYASVSSSTFRLRFVKAVGMTVRAYIENARLLVAMRLLTYPEIDIYLISDAVGYAHYGTFYRAFRRHIGCPPSEYRDTFPTVDRSGTDERA